MNQKNVTAIAEAVVAFLQKYGYLDLGMHDTAEDCGEFAEFLANRGVLVPSAVAPVEVKRMDPGIQCINGDSGMAQTDCCEECASAWRSALEKIAKGEST